MDKLLVEFEEKYPFLYDVRVHNMPIYTSLRDALLLELKKQTAVNADYKKKKSRIFWKRVWHGIVKFKKVRTAETMIVTSSVYRRDEKRNLSAEFLRDTYPNSVILEWPSRNASFDKGYFTDPCIQDYYPMDLCAILKHIYLLLHKKKYRKLRDNCSKELAIKFSETPKEAVSEKEQQAIRWLINRLSDEVAATTLSHYFFRFFFKNCKHIKTAIDFWGGARENIFPILPQQVSWIELQHGLITKEHTGYMYPSYVKKDCKLFERKLLVYGKKTKQILLENSFFQEEQIEVVGNPRLNLYKKTHSLSKEKRGLLLFSSQPYEQDKKGVNYYESMRSYMKVLEEYANHNGMTFGIKLHPREEGVDTYRSMVPSAVIYESDAELYELLCKTWVHITANSTVLYEAAVFDVPTITIRYLEYDTKQIFGKDVWEAGKPEDLYGYFNKLKKQTEYEKYLGYLKNITEDSM